MSHPTPERTAGSPTVHKQLGLKAVDQTTCTGGGGGLPFRMLRLLENTYFFPKNLYYNQLFMYIHHSSRKMAQNK